MSNHLERALGKELYDEIQKSKLLVVGAGGIGCELVKDLVQGGFCNLHIIDLDTIDVSNLNRQFLFRKEHVGMSKSMVAREAALKFNPNVSIQAYHGNIKEDQFGVNFFKEFDLVLNALDNVNARQHVNRLCLTVGIPLLDAGTAGYLGQTTVIYKGVTECFDCQPKSTNTKTFPICTIRNTPDKPVHCIVWAKEFFKLLFGRVDESMLSGSDVDGDAEETAENENQQQEMKIRSSIMNAVTRPTEFDDKTLENYARCVFEAVFNNEIKLKLEMRDGYKGAKKKPTPLCFDDALKHSEDVTMSGATALKDQRVWSIKECVEVFVECVKKMWSEEHRSTIGDAVFDKDDAIAMDFVTATAGLRSFIFGIERKSKFDTKGIAGNIVHAIATTNAIVAGLQVLDAYKILANLKSKALPSTRLVTNELGDVTRHCSSVFVVRQPVGPYLLNPVALHPPHDNCYSCGNATLTLHINVETATLETLVTKVLKNKLGVNSPTIMLGTNEIYAEGDDLDEDEVEFFKQNLPKILIDCPAGGIKSGTILDIEDNTQNVSFKIIVQQADLDTDESPEGYHLDGKAPVAKESHNKEEHAEHDHDEICILDDEIDIVDSVKRPASTNGNSTNGETHKRHKHSLE